MEWCRTRRKGGVSQYLTIQVYMRSKRLGSGVCSFANYLLTEEAPLQKASGSSPRSAAVSHSCVLVQPMDFRAPRSMTCAPPPKASRRGREQVIA